MRRAGHLGTLDPMATGLLAILAGPSTRLAPFFEKEEKTYQAKIRFGWVSDTYDAEGSLQATGIPLPAEPAVRAALESFLGRFEQMPPAVSAKKIDGVPAYKLARKKLPVCLRPVEVEIKRLVIGELQAGEISLEVTCSAGTYIRSLAHDVGVKLGCGALLSGLRRTAIGSLQIAAAHTLDQLQDLARENRLAEALIPAAALLAHLPVERVDEVVEARIRQGREFHTSPFVVPPGSPVVRVLSRSGVLVAIGRLVIPNLYHPATVFLADD